MLSNNRRVLKHLRLLGSGFVCVMFKSVSSKAETYLRKDETILDKLRRRQIVLLVSTI